MTMFHHMYCTGHRSIILVFAGTVALVISQPIWSASCVGPAPLEVRVHAHPDADAYAALGIWLGENRKSECAVQTIQAGLKLEPNSFRLPESGVAGFRDSYCLTAASIDADEDG
jgi:hypothetical protein